MGRYRSGADTTEQYHSVDIRKIRIKRLLRRAVNSRYAGAGAVALQVL